MTHIIHDLGVARQIGAYSDAIEARPNQRWLLTSGTPGLSTTGDLPKDVSSQAERAGITVTEIVKVTQYLTRAEDTPACGKVRRRFLGDVRPASMPLVILQLVRSEFLVEIEIVAAKA